MISAYAARGGAKADIADVSDGPEGDTGDLASVFAVFILITSSCCSACRQASKVNLRIASLATKVRNLPRCRPNEAIDLGAPLYVIAL